MAEQSGKKNKSKRALVIAFVSILVIVNGIKLYLDHEEKKELNNELAMQEVELDSINMELDLRIEEIRKLGGDVEELTRAKEDLEEQKEWLETNREANRKLIQRLAAKVDGYEELLVIKDEEIEKLKSLNQELLTENTELKTEKTQLSRSIRQLNQNQEQLEEKIAIASRLEAENISLVAINSRGKEREAPFRSRQIDQLKVEFNIAKNDVAPIEGKNIMIRILDSNGQVLFDVARGSGTFMIDGKEEFYTANQEILFDNTGQLITFVYDKGSSYESGEYTMEIYTEGYLMGSTKFVVK